MKAQNPLETATAKNLIEEIENHISNNSTLYTVYSNWYCGITKHQDNTRKNGHKSKKQTKALFWELFNARSVRIALALETYFHDKGMLDSDEKGGYDKQNSKFVYVYKLHPTIIDQITENK